jgi:hypothetical protein
MSNNHENIMLQDFKLGGTHLKKLRRAKGGAKNFGVFRVKNHDFTPKNHIFSNFKGGARRVHLSGSAPVLDLIVILKYFYKIRFHITN